MNQGSKITGSLFPGLCMLTAFIIMFHGCQQKVNDRVAETPQTITKVESLLQQMTVEEKLGQLNQFRWTWADNQEAVRDSFRLAIKKGRLGSLLGVSGVDHTRRLQELAVDSSRLGIPLLFAQDVIHGWRTTFPIPLAEAASWDTAAVRLSAHIAAIEASAAGNHWTYAPMVDIARDARWGRIMEGSGEDPYLGAAMAVARVRGFQGNDLSAPNTMLACAKHFAAYGGAEAGRDYNTVDISERTLREIYLPPFHAAVRAGVGSFMGSFNEISGVPMHANTYLNCDVLRGEWGFDGVYISDYTGVMELMLHGIAATPVDAGIAALTAGVDVDMVSGIYINDLPAAVDSARLAAALLDQAVRRVLTAKERLGLFDDPYRYNDPEREKKLTLTAEHMAASREVAQKSIVLLKNENNLLPLDHNLGSIAVIGALADDSLSQLGSWRGIGRPGDATTVLAGIRQAVGHSSEVLYHPAYNLTDFTAIDNFDEAMQVAEGANVVLLVIGETARMSGEASNRASIELPGDQVELAKRLRASGKPVIVLLMNGRPLAIPWIAENIPAVVEGWYLGSQMGPAVADVLFGHYNPSGKLPVTFPRATGQIPIYYNHKNTGRPPDENSYYTSKYLDVHWTPQFPFGWGLGYTTFEYDKLSIERSTIGADDTIAVSITVTNAGQRAGQEVVQFYLQDMVASVTRPVRELKGFRKVFLEPGESRRISFQLPKDQLAFYDRQMQKLVESGEFRVYIGGNSRDTISASFWVE